MSSMNTAKMVYTDEEAQFRETSGLSLRTKIKNLSPTPGVSYDDFSKYLTHFCHKVNIPGLDLNATTLLLTLAHRSGYSAQLISTLIHQKFGIEILPEVIWDLHRRWNQNREFRPFAGDEVFFPLCFAENGVVNDFSSFLIKTVSERPRPVSCFCLAIVWMSLLVIKISFDIHASPWHTVVIEYLGLWYSQVCDYSLVLNNIGIGNANNAL